MRVLPFDGGSRPGQQRSPALPEGTYARGAELRRSSPLTTTRSALPSAKATTAAPSTCSTTSGRASGPYVGQRRQARRHPHRLSCVTRVSAAPVMTSATRRWAIWRPTMAPSRRSPGRSAVCRAAAAGGGQGGLNNQPHTYGIVERTFSEWIGSQLDTLEVSNFDTLPADLKVAGGCPGGGLPALAVGQLRRHAGG